MSDDFKALNRQLLSQISTLLPSWFPAGKQHGREFRLGDLQGAAGQSLAINLDTGVWKDFAGGKGGADLISLYAAANNIKQGDAFSQLGGVYKKKAGKTEATWMPGHKCDKIPKHRRLKIEPVAVYDYYNQDGKRVGHIARFQPAGERKEFCPLTHWRNSDGTAYWAWKKAPGTSYLYRLRELLLRPDAKVLIVEGEGKCDHAQQIEDLKGFAVVAWPGGAKNILNVDWTPLRGRDVWIWPDNDADGIAAAQNIKAILPDLKIIQIPAGTPESWDLGDAPLDIDVISHFVENKELQPKAATPTQTDKKSNNLADRLDALNSEFAVIIHGSKVFVMRHWMGQDGQSKLIFLTARDFLFLQENNVVYLEDDDGKVKEVAVAKQWLKWKDRQEYEEAYFEPCGPEYSKRYNLWRGFSYTAKEGDCSLFLAHIHDNICNGNKEYYEWVMAWLADLFQKPARKLGTSLVLRGPMGIGKGVFASHIGKLLGKHYMPISQRSQLIGKFNSHMADKLLMFVDEGWWSDDSNYGVGVLRNLITEPEVTIEMKGKDAITLANFTRFIVAANEDWVVPVSGKDERRFSVLDVSADRQGDKAYFSAIRTQMHAGGYDALLHLLLNHKYAESLPGKILNTPALADNKMYSMPPELQWWHECLMKREIGDFSLNDDNNNDMECDRFYEEYRKWCERMQLRPVTFTVLPKKLKDAIVNFNKTRKLFDSSGKRRHFYALQKVSTMRLYFCRHLDVEFDWEDDVL
jgi:Family of unknown function (DUF5906)